MVSTEMKDKLKDSMVRIEKWYSSEGNTEIHYFRKEDDVYLFGYNPLLFPNLPEEFFEKFL